LLLKKVLLTSPMLGQVLEAGLAVPTLNGMLEVAMIALGIGEAGDCRGWVCTLTDQFLGVVSLGWVVFVFFFGNACLP